MATTAIATLHPVWDCRWSRPGHRLIAEPGERPRESHWTCVREGEPRPVLQEECSACGHWEPRLAAAALVGAAAASAGAFVDAVPARARPMPLTELQDFGARAVLVLTAVGMFVVGFTQLTSMTAIPFVILLWLCAAALVGIVAFASFDGHAPPYADRCEHGSHGGGELDQPEP